MHAHQLCVTGETRQSGRRVLRAATILYRDYQQERQTDEVYSTSCIFSLGRFLLLYLRLQLVSSFQGKGADPFRQVDVQFCQDAPLVVRCEFDVNLMSKLDKSEQIINVSLLDVAQPCSTRFAIRDDAGFLEDISSGWQRLLEQDHEKEGTRSASPTPRLPLT